MEEHQSQTIADFYHQKTKDCFRGAFGCRTKIRRHTEKKYLRRENIRYIFLFEFQREFFVIVDKEIEIKELSCGFTSDSISDGVFGLDGTGMSDPSNDKMRKLGNRVINIFMIYFRTENGWFYLWKIN